MTMYENIIRMNQEGWSRKAYEAWVKGKGTPEQLARELRRDPWKKLNPFRPHLGDIRGKRIANLLGSYGKTAVSLTLLGAEVTVVDLSPENARYAKELARCAGVEIRYIVSDVMRLPEDGQLADYDMVVMELGILHWIMEIGPFFRIVGGMLKRGGRLILRDFHPVKRGLLRWEHGQMIASGNYFDESIHEEEVPYASLLPEEERAELTKVATRGWTMGQIITAMAEAGFFIRLLQEESGTLQHWVFPEDAPAGMEDRIPGLYTIVADFRPRSMKR